MDEVAIVCGGGELAVAVVVDDHAAAAAAVEAENVHVGAAAVGEVESGDDGAPAKAENAAGGTIAFPIPAKGALALIGVVLGVTAGVVAALRMKLDEENGMDSVPSKMDQTTQRTESVRPALATACSFMKSISSCWAWLMMPSATNRS